MDLEDANTCDDATLREAWWRGWRARVEGGARPGGHGFDTHHLSDTMPGLDYPFVYEWSNCDAETTMERSDVQDLSANLHSINADEMSGSTSTGPSPVPGGSNATYIEGSLRRAVQESTTGASIEEGSLACTDADGGSGTGSSRRRPS